MIVPCFINSVLRWYKDRGGNMPYKILIVDDAAFMRNMIKDVFESMPGFSVIGEASNGIEAVEKYKALHPDLVTMDIVMPLKSGIEATKEITSVDREAKIIMCSALGQESLVMEAVEAGARDFIVKPFKAEKVQEVVNRVLGIKA